MSGNPINHLDANGSVRMVDVSAKKMTKRTASAESFVNIGVVLSSTLQEKGGLAKGNVIETAKIAGIMAAKRTSEWIPLCHPIPVDSIRITAEFVDGAIRFVSHVDCEAKTGVEMEAMTAVAAASLTVYDMVKSAGKSVEIGPIRLLEKTGGKSGHWRRGDG